MTRHTALLMLVCLAPYPLTAPAYAAPDRSVEKPIQLKIGGSSARTARHLQQNVRVYRQYGRRKCNAVPARYYYYTVSPCAQGLCNEFLGAYEFSGCD
ncbi:hypothetical protein [Methylobacterium oxalidis]|uniref:Uncharacterized protein n=1 Tax=Methylobacterium oxalidis TaxID=944322 RepID=A0A512JB16_9HYPH|nr:hypothetical protein [Methylobacterium oxalidis]GEP07111.1 hypothetical protein MOX02_51490 [Methylobacterium oxalidis]GJE34001.1 hypothetical protein LDDCCGHA_4205 [Methylobacterium oxalidis]GLS66178.1 hypothetical protein GCM10007888_45600 [Methylobacterium oxalidis]